MGREKFWRGIEPWNEMAYKQVYLKKKERKLEKLTFN